MQRELARLVESGLVQVNLQGRQKRYKANPDSPVYSELSSLVSKLLGADQEVEDALQPIDHKIDLALICGSVAKGTEHANSDVDLLLVSDILTLEEVFHSLAPAEIKTKGTDLFSRSSPAPTFSTYADSALHSLSEAPARPTCGYLWPREFHHHK